MGTSLTSVQVHLGSKPKTDTRAAVIEAMRQHVLESGFVETNPAEDQNPDRTVLIGPAGDGPWLTVYDSQGNLRELARHLSARVGDAAVFINLIDSDVIHLRLYRAGDLVDDYCNDPNSYDLYGADPDRMADWGDLPKSQFKALTRGHPAKWRNLFVEGTDAKALRALWSSKPVLADDILWATAKALGMDAEEILSIGEILWVAYMRFHMGSQEFGSPGKAETFTRLTFRLSKTPAYEVKATGLPKLSFAGSGSRERVYVGDAFELMVSVQNDGGAATGLDIVAWGSAIDNGIVKLASVNIQSAEHPLDPLAVDFKPSRITTGDQEMKSLLARADALKLPQGIEGGDRMEMQPGVDWRKVYDAQRLTQIDTKIRGSVVTTGSGNLSVAFVPHANRTEGQTVFEMPLEALPKPRRPLRHQEAAGSGSSELLQKISTPRHLFALVALDTDRQRAAALAANVLQTWAAGITRQSGKAIVTHLRPQVDTKPDRKRLPKQQVADSTYWKNVRKTLETCVTFSMDARVAQVIFDADPTFFQHGREELVPQLAFRYTVEKMNEEAMISEENRLVAIVDQLMGAGAVAQALVGRWDWGPYFFGVNSTPYEAASGVRGQFTTARFWCRRYLRGVTEKLWLGPDLVAQLGGTDALTSIAEVTPVGNGIRVVLNQGAMLDQLEAALAPLLPGEKEWREGAERMYPRQREGQQ